MHFGEHITIDGYMCNPLKLNDKELVYFCLDELPNKLGLHKIAVPLVYFANGGSLKDHGGWSGFVIIEESHLSIHTFPATKFISIDVYTCQNNLDTPLISDFFKQVFEITELEINFIIRGKKYKNYLA